MAPIRVVCLAVAVAALFVAVASTLRVTIDSDTLFAVLLHQDLHTWGGHVGEWNLPPAPCWFPDIALVWTALSLGLSSVTALRVAGIGLLALALGGWVVIAERRAPMGIAIGLMVSTLPLLAAAGVQLEAHGGITALTPWIVWLVLRRRLALASVLVVLLTASDSLALATLVLPLALALRNRQSWRLVLAGLFGAGAGRLLRPRTLLASYMDIDPSDSWRSLLALGHWLRTMWGQQTWTVLWVLLALAVLVHAAWRRSSLPVRFVLWSLAITLGSLVSFGQFLDDGGARYVMPVLLSLVACALWQATRAVRLSARSVWSASGGLAVLAVTVYVRSLPAPPVPRSELLSPLEHELEARGLHYGAAPYWDAKLLTALSTHGIFLSALAPDRVTPYAWNANARWPLRFEPTFLLLPAADPTHELDARRLYGAPAERIVLLDHVILTYADPTRIARHFAPYLVDFSVAGAEAWFDARDGERTAQLGYRGPHVMLPPGRYRLLLTRAPSSLLRGGYRVRVGRHARAEGDWPAELEIDVPRAAPLLVEIAAAADAVQAVTVRRLD